MVASRERKRSVCEQGLSGSVVGFRRLLSDFLWPQIDARLRESLDARERTLISEAGRRIDYEDPLRSDPEAEQRTQEALAQAANHVGRNVIVGRCTLWGGRSPSVAGLRLADNVRLYDGCRLVIDHLSTESGIDVGDGAALNFNCYVDGSGGVKVGAGAILGPNVVILSSSHGAASGERNKKELKPVRIGERAWIGANTVILAGAEIGNGAVIGAGSVVRDQIPGDVVAAGSPARVIRTIA